MISSKLLYQSYVIDLPDTISDEDSKELEETIKSIVEKEVRNATHETEAETKRKIRYALGFNN
mgnify:CR=1 FL=1